MILYGSSLSPFVRKVLAFADEKRIELDLQSTGGFAEPKPEYLEASPFRKMPAFRDGDYTLADSSRCEAARQSNLVRGIRGHDPVRLRR